MVYVNTILESLIQVCRDSPRLPQAVTYASVELDTESEHADLHPPVIEFTPVSVDRDTSRNTEWVGPEYDESGTQIGYRFTRWYDAEIIGQVTTVSGQQYTHRELSQAIEESLSLYESSAPHQVQKMLPDPNQPSAKLADVDWLHVHGYQPDNNFNMNLSTRERSIQTEVGFTHELRTSELGVTVDHVEDVDLTACVVDASGTDRELDL